MILDRSCCVTAAATWSDEEGCLLTEPVVSRPPLGTVVSLTAVLLLAVNLRPVLSSVPPLTVDIQESLGWGDVEIGLLSAIPVLCLALAAPLVPRLAAWTGRVRGVVLGLSLIALGAASRLSAELWAPILVLSAAIGGVGIAICSVLLPSFVRQWFPAKATSTTGMTTALLIVGAAAAAASAVPLSAWLGSWTASLALWSIPAVVAVIAWLLIGRRLGRLDDVQSTRAALPWRSPAAWSIAAYLAFNGVVFYALVAWMALSYDERGWTQVEGGLLLGYGTAMQVIGAIVVSRLVQRFDDRRPAYVVLVLVTSAALLLIGVAPEFQTWIVIGVVQTGLGASFALGLALLPEYATSPDAAARATAMAFLIAYACASVSPVLFGGLASALDSWTVVYVVLAVVSLGQLGAILSLRRGATID